jgi:hypothetical protein
LRKAYIVATVVAIATEISLRRAIVSRSTNKWKGVTKKSSIAHKTRLASIKITTRFSYILCAHKGANSVIADTVISTIEVIASSASISNRELLSTSAAKRRAEESYSTISWTVTASLTCDDSNTGSVLASS